MNSFVRIIIAEIKKQHRSLHQSKFIYFSMLLWPILIFINAYYMYKPFNLSTLATKYGISSEKGILTFLISGYMAYNVFWSMVQSAWQMSEERRSGTLETVFLSPANRLAIIYGRALGSLVESVWMFTIFSIVVIFISSGMNFKYLITLPIIFIILIVAATIWGGLLNSIFLFSRDASFLFDIFDDPMCLFSGVRVPVEAFPFWGKIIAIVFPLTHALKAIREILNTNNILDGGVSIAKLVLSLIAMILITLLVIRAAEKNARKKGNLLFY